MQRNERRLLMPATTSVLASGNAIPIGGDFDGPLIDHLDTSAVRDVRFYISGSFPACSQVDLFVWAESPEGTSFLLDHFGLQYASDVVTGCRAESRFYEVAGPSLTIQFLNFSDPGEPPLFGNSGTVSFMLVGR